MSKTVQGPFAMLNKQWTPLLRADEFTDSMIRPKDLKGFAQQNV